jgi:MFS family permease
VNQREPQTKPRYPHGIRALRHQNFRRYYIGQTASLLGSWIQSVALLWMVYRLSGSTGTTGTIAFLGLLPYLIVTPFAGLLADRMPRRNLLLIVHSCLLVLATVISVLSYLGYANVPVLGVFAVILGILNAIEITTRHSYFAQLIDDKNDLPNALALNSININGTRLIGPAVGGLLIAAYSETVCFALNAVSYLAVIAQLKMMPVVAVSASNNDQHPLTQLLDGWRFAHRSNIIWPLVLTAGGVSLFMNSYTVLMPAITTEVFGKGAGLNGVLLSGVGAGALLGGVLIAMRKSIRGLSTWILLTVVSAGLGAMLFAVLAQFKFAPASFLAIALMGFGIMGTSVSVNTIIQTVVDDAYRGRVISVYSTFFVGATPIGQLAAGWLAEHIGPIKTMMVCSAACFCVAALYAHHLPKLRLILRSAYSDRGVASR